MDDQGYPLREVCPGASWLHCIVDRELESPKWSLKRLKFQGKMVLNFRYFKSCGLVGWVSAVGFSLPTWLLTRELRKFLGSINRTEESLELFQNAVAMGIKVLGAHNPVPLRKWGSDPQLWPWNIPKMAKEIGKTMTKHQLSGTTFRIWCKHFLPPLPRSYLGHQNWSHFWS
jgi:hypothetical protein